MALPLLPTKISIPPLPRNRLERPHLQRLLDAGLTCPLTLLSAPAGFGKTTAILSWLQTVERPVAWLSLDEGDGDPLRFWRYLGESLVQAIPTLTRLPHVHDGEDSATIARALAAGVIANLVESEAEAVIVLEDYHMVDQAGAETESIHDSLNYFLDYLPAHIHVVLLTRSDPPLKLSRRRVRNQINEIRAADLRFSPEEVEAFFNRVLALDIPAPDASALASRAEGWAAGLQLVALALQSSSLRQAPSERRDFISSLVDSNRYITAYLLEEVLQRQPPDVEYFLLHTSIVERFDASLCAALTGAAQPQVMLNRLEEANLFIVPLDHQGRWFRYHRLFRDLLQERLRRRYGEETVADLHRQAARWYEAYDYLGEAVAHALAAEAFEHVAALLEAHALTIIFRRTETKAVARWLNALPEPLVRERPLLSLVGAWLDLLQMRPLSEIERRLAEVEQAMAQEETGQVVRTYIQAHMGALRAFLARVYRSDFAEAIACSQQALRATGIEQTSLRAIIWDNLTQAYLARGEVEAAEKGINEMRQLGLASGYYINVLTADFLEALVARFRGKLALAERLCLNALDSAARSAKPQQRPLPYAGAVYAVLGTVLYQWNRLQEAADALEKASELLALTGEHGIHLYAMSELARVRHAQGHDEQALALLEKASERLPSRYFSNQYLAAVARSLALPVRLEIEEEIDLAWVEETGVLAVGTSIVRAANFRGLLHYTKALSQTRALIQRRRRGEPVNAALWKQLLELLEQWSAEAAESGWQERLMELSLLKALACAAVEAEEEALAALKQALTLGKQGGYIRLFVDEGPVAAALLYRAAEAGVDPDYAGRILSHFPATASAGQQSPQSQLVEPLSERELEVLAHIAAGMTNREIATELTIALSTVKAHARNIYGKLNVGNRTEAVARARDLRLKF